MKETMKERKQKLYDKATKLRSHFLAVERTLTKKYERLYPEKKWYEIAQLVEQDTEYVKASASLLAFCEACNIIGVESGE